MSLGNKLGIVAVAAVLGGLIVPTFGQNGSNDMQGAPNQGMRMGHMGQRMMQGGMVSHGMMAGWLFPDDVVDEQPRWATEQPMAEAFA